MLENDHTTQDGFEEPTDDEQHCPECGDPISGFERNGVTGNATARPCGHDVGALTVRDITNGQPRVATDGGEELSDEQVYWLRNFRAYLRDHVDELDADDVQIETDDDIAAAYIPTPGLDRKVRAGICNDLAAAGFRVVSGTRDEDLTIGFGDKLEEQYADPELVADGSGEVECEVQDADEHNGPVKVVKTEGGRITAACESCRRDLAVERVVDHGAGRQDTAPEFGGGA